MRITIEECEAILGGRIENPLESSLSKEAFTVAIDTMRKYQKIVGIVSLNDEEFKQCGLKELKEILEVVADERT